MVTILRTQDVRVSYRAVGEDDVPGTPETDLLSSDERARCARLVFARDRRDFAAAHALVRAGLSRHADTAPSAWVFDTLPGGKPTIVSSSGAPPLSFNLSHTRGFVACAVAGGADVGIDVESVDRALDGQRIATRYFSQPECDGLAACNARERAIRFIELWTLKEAYIKAIGRGLRQPLNEFGFAFEGERVVRFCPPPDVQASAWTFALFAPTAQYRMALAIRVRPGEGGSILAQSADGTVTTPVRRSEGGN